MVFIGWWLTAKLHGDGRQKKTARRKKRPAAQW
jgi:hypothetical protein